MLNPAAIFANADHNLRQNWRAEQIHSTRPREAWPLAIYPAPDCFQALPCPTAPHRAIPRPTVTCHTSPSPISELLPRRAPPDQALPHPARPHLTQPDRAHALPYHTTPN